MPNSSKIAYKLKDITSGDDAPWLAGCPTIRKMNIFKSNFPIFDLVYGAILIYMAISCLISIMISHFKFLKIIIGQPACHGEPLERDPRGLPLQIDFTKS
jgi:hypothetical protein